MEANEEPTSHISSSYGRACANCVRAKAKCIHGSGVGIKCERYTACPFKSLQILILRHARCLRLNKDCQPTQSIRKRKVTIRPSATKDQRLEAKLDGLYKLLQSSTASTSIAGQSTSAPRASSSHQPISQSLQTPAASPGASEHPESSSIPPLNWSGDSIDVTRMESLALAPDASYVVSGTKSTITYCPNISIINCSEPSFDEAEECLNLFRTSMTTYFPFVNVSESTTARDLRRERPFLWLCIMSIASKSVIQQKRLGREVRITMGRDLLVECKNSIDLLMGLLVFVAWYVGCGPIIRV